MHVCLDCGKAYKSQNSLNRHSQNHRRQKQHHCSTCGVAFGRRDLLSRHLRIHKSGALDSLASHQLRDRSQRAPSSRRRRCHTACTRCAGLRRKCSGQRPCEACVAVEATCEFPRPAGRISQADDLSASPLPSEVQSEWAGLEHTPTASLEPFPLAQSSWQHTELGAVPMPIQADAGFSMSSSMASKASRDDEFLSEDLFASTALANHALGADGAGIDIDMAQDFNDLVSWPWIHESLYLLPQESPQAILPDRSGSSTLGRNTSFDRLATRFTDTISHQQLAVEGEENSQMSAASHHGAAASNFRPPVTLEARGIREDHSHSERSVAHPGRSSRQEQVVAELVTHAAMTSPPTASNSDHGAYWQSMSPNVHDAFQLDLLVPSDTLWTFVLLYLDHFSPLWPLLSRQNLKINSLHPLLFLVLTSIGAMYGVPSAVRYGTMMHNRVRTYLTVAFELDEDENDLMWLAQARLLTQVAALYFGQPKAFTYSQFLGALVVTQARRMDLFSAAKREHKLSQFNHLKHASRDSDRFAIWLHLEARRRLAFGIFRGDIYTSVLLGTMPLLSLEEIDLPFPTCDAVWREEPMPTQTCLHIIDHDRTPSAGLRASDIFRMALDPAELLPPLDPTAHELLLFGLQRPVWQFSHDHKMLERLTGGEAYLEQLKVFSHHGSIDFHAPGDLSFRHTTSNSEGNQLENSGRKMEKLLSEYHNLLSALSKWEKALSFVKSFAAGKHDRSSLLSSLVLFHLGYLRLLAPIDDLHQVQYRLAEGRQADSATLRSIYNWAHSESAHSAVERACNIWSLIQREMQRDEAERVRCNLLAFIGLHHGAVLLWSYAGAHSDDARELNKHHLPSNDETVSSIPIVQEESQKILSCFIDMFHRVSPGGWSSFAKAARKLASHDFPTMPTNHRKRTAYPE